MSERFEKMEKCLRLGASHSRAAAGRLEAMLADADWRVRYAAAVALGDLGSEGSVPALMAALRREDQRPLYSQKEDLAGGPAGSPARMRRSEVLARQSEETLEAWRCRGRVKQAVCFALAEMGAAAVEALPMLSKYAVDQGEDYAVRAAACRAIGLIGPAQCAAVLEQACQDGEWCTKTSARKALALARAGAANGR